MYEGIVYFAGPKSRWAGVVSDDEVIARVSSGVKWFARLHVLSIHANLNPERCGYVLLKDGKAVEHYDPPVTE